MAYLKHFHGLQRSKVSTTTNRPLLIMFLSQEETNMWLLTLEGKVSFHQIHIHITHTHIVTLKYTYTHSQRHMYEHIVTFEKSPQYALGHASSSPHISWSLGPGTMSVLPRGKKSGHLCTLSWTRLHISLRSLNKSLLRSKEWHPSSGKLPLGQVVDKEIILIRS